MNHIFLGFLLCALSYQVFASNNCFKEAKNNGKDSVVIEAITSRVVEIVSDELEDEGYKIQSISKTFSYSLDHNNYSWIRFYSATKRFGHISVKDAEGNDLKEIVVDVETGEQSLQFVTRDVKSTKTTLPFIKKNEFDYEWIVSFAGEAASWLKWVLYAIAIILIITAVSNAANLTDGIDGLAAGTSAISGATLGVLAYVSGNIIYSDYLNIMYIPNIGELTIFIAAFIGLG